VRGELVAHIARHSRSAIDIHEMLMIYQQSRTPRCRFDRLRHGGDQDMPMLDAFTEGVQVDALYSQQPMQGL
jgi:hypothetical protein